MNEEYVETGDVVSDAREADLPALGAIDETFSSPPHPGAQKPSVHERIAALREELARPWARLWTVRDPSGQPFAFLLAWHVADELHVLNVATEPAWQRRGYGRRLMLHAFAYARQNALRLVLLEVRRSNLAAISLYRSLGFHATSIRRHYYGDGEDAIEMAAVLDRTTGEIVPKEDEVAVGT